MDPIIYFCECCDQEYSLPEEVESCPLCLSELRDIALEWE